MPTDLPRPARSRAKPALALIEPAGREIAPGFFDPAFYLDTYADVAQAKDDPLDHFLRYGRAELRYPSEAALAEDIRAVESSGQFNPEDFRRLYGSFADPVRRFLLNYRFGPLKPNASFDGDFVSSYYRRSLTPGENPFLFYCRHRTRPWCFQSMAEAASAADVLARSPLFDPAFFRASYLAGQDELSPEHYYLTEGFRLLWDPSPGFSTAAYLYDSPDIAAAQMNPLLHYERGGRAEFRPVSSGADVQMLDGAIGANPKRKTVLLVSHQASRTGAPILALNLLRRLTTQFNVVSLLLEGGVLLEDFRRQSCAVAVSGARIGAIEVAVQAIMRDRAIDCALLNTVVSVQAIEPLARRGVPILTLIHDFAQHTRPLGLASRAVALSDRIIYPAEIVRDAALAEIEGLLGAPARPSNTEVRAQGRCLVPFGGESKPAPLTPERAMALGEVAAARPLIVLGAGHVELRKGVDLFIEAARAVKDDLGVDCRFVWVGGGYEPEIDAGISTYLQDQVRKSGLDGCVLFVEAQDSLDPWFEAADAFFMSSRLDPYPNVVLDALAGGVPVVCFDKTTGVAELARDFPDQVAVAPYLRPREAAELLVSMGRAERAGKRIDKGLQRRLDFGPYADHVSRRLREVMDQTALRNARAGSLCDLGLLDPVSFARSLPSWLVSPLCRAGPTADHLSRLAARLSASNLPVATLRRGASSLQAAVNGEGTDAGYRSIEATAAGAGAPEVIVACADHVEGIRQLADYIFRTMGGPKVLVITHALTATDLAPLRAVLPRNGVRLMTMPEKGDAKSLVADVAAAIPSGAVVQLVRFSATSTGPTALQAAPRLSPAFDQSAWTALADDQDLRLVLARAPPSPLPRLFAPSPAADGTGLAIPGHMIDQQQCWFRAGDPGFTGAIVNEMVASFADVIQPAMWGSTIAEAGLGCAVVEAGGARPTAFDLVWGREEFDW